MIPRSYLLVPILLILACSTRNNPRAVSEDFIYNYYQHANQEAALKLSHGLAAEKREVRGPGEQVEEMPKMEYELMGKEEEATTALFNYRLTIKSRGGTTTHTRNIVINTEQINGQWKVVNFDEY